MTPADALARLERGNARFSKGKHLHRNLLHQAKVTGGHQYPFAIVLSCIDSRTSTELIFDQGIGDVFNARVAGNIVDDDMLASLEYACGHAGSKLIAVVGHTHCGAVKSTCEHQATGRVARLLARIQPALDATPTSTGETRTADNQKFLDRVAKENVRRSIAAIRAESKELKKMEDEKTIKIVGGIHDIETGKVDFFTEAKPTR